jgi:SAM-dependent methyltransferase
MASSSELDSFYERFWQDADYQLRYALQAAVHERFPAIQKVWGEMPSPRRVLDFGCGNGVLTHRMHSQGFGAEIVGVDVSATALQFARLRFARPGLRFETLSGHRGLADLGAFDVVVASHVLEHLPDPDRALSEMTAIAEWLLLEVPLEDCGVSRLISALGWRDRTQNPVGHVKFWTRTSFRALLDAAGLVVVRDFRYAAAPFSPYQSRGKRLVQRAVLRMVGVRAYGQLLSTHYAVLARPRGNRTLGGAE